MEQLLVQNRTKLCSPSGQSERDISRLIAFKRNQLCRFPAFSLCTQARFKGQIRRSSELQPCVASWLGKLADQRGSSSVIQGPTGPVGSLLSTKLFFALHRADVGPDSGAFDRCFLTCKAGRSDNKESKLFLPQSLPPGCNTAGDVASVDQRFIRDPQPGDEPPC